MPRPLDPDWHRVDRKKKHVISVGWIVGSVKLCMLQFDKNGIFVHFPYHPDVPGLLSRGELHAGKREQHVHLENAGAVTSHKVKYSHHMDGNAHFSQDGLIRTAVRGHAADLRTHAGHIFSIDVQGLAQFAEFSTEEYYGDKYGRGYFELQGPEPEAVHIVGRWGVLPTEKRIEEFKNPMRFRSGGREGEGIGMAPPPGSPLESGFVIIEASPRERMSEDPFMLLFTGGFEAGLRDPNVDSAFLALKYPAGTDDLPNIDYLQDKP